MLESTLERLRGEVGGLVFAGRDGQKNGDGDGESRARFVSGAHGGAGANASGDTIGGAARPVGTLHLTVGVMSLMGEGKEEEAMGVLRGLDFGAMLGGTFTAATQGEKHEKEVEAVSTKGSDGSQVTQHSPSAQPLVVTLEGLHAMRSPSSTSSLYMAPRDTTNRLHRFCEVLRETFIESGLMVNENRPLKLHVTVLNTIYARPGGRRGIGVGGTPAPLGKAMDDPDKGGETKEREGEDEDGAQEEQKEESNRDGNADVQSQNAKYGPGDKGGRKRQRPRSLLFDARPVLERFKDFEWAKDLRLDRVAICKMGAQKILDDSGKVVDEAYEEVAVRELPWIS